MPCEDMFMSNDLQERSDQILHKGAYGWGLEMLCCEQKTNVNPQSGLLPPLGNKIPVESLVTGTVCKAVLSDVVFAWSIQSFKLHEKGEQTQQRAHLSVVIHNNKKAIQYKGLNARLLITQYAHVIQSHHCSHYMWIFATLSGERSKWHFHASKH